MVDARLSGNKRGKCSDMPFLTALLLGYLFSVMVRVVDCYAGVLGSNPGGPRIFSPWNYFSVNAVRYTAAVSFFLFPLSEPPWMENSTYIVRITYFFLS